MRVCRPNLSRKPRLPVLASLSGALIHRARMPPPTAGAGVVTYGVSNHWKGLSTVSVSASLS